MAVGLSCHSSCDKSCFHYDLSFNHNLNGTETENLCRTQLVVVKHPLTMKRVTMMKYIVCGFPKCYSVFSQRASLTELCTVHR